MTQERLQELLAYDSSTGFFTWKIRKAIRLRAGDRAGYDHPSGYRYIKIDNRSYSEHRLAWLYVHGRLPSEEIDHINRNRAKCAELLQAEVWMMFSYWRFLVGLLIGLAGTRALIWMVRRIKERRCR